MKIILVYYMKLESLHYPHVLGTKYVRVQGSPPPRVRLDTYGMRHLGVSPYFTVQIRGAGRAETVVFLVDFHYHFNQRSPNLRFERRDDQGLIVSFPPPLSSFRSLASSFRSFLSISIGYLRLEVTVIDLCFQMCIN